MKFLVVDDSAVMRKVLMKELSELGVLTKDIEQAADGTEAVEMTSNAAEEYGLILLDWNMPNMLGIDALAEMRKRGVKSPILMVTTEAEKGNVVRAIQAGANNYLVKPFTKEDFSQKVMGMAAEAIKAAEKANQMVDLDTGRIGSD